MISIVCILLFTLDKKYDKIADDLAHGKHMKDAQ